MPHSEIPGSPIARISPGLFAACHALHRLSVPRHPPDALKTLDPRRPSRRRRKTRHSQGQTPLQATHLAMKTLLPLRRMTRTRSTSPTTIRPRPPASVTLSLHLSKNTPKGSTPNGKLITSTNRSYSRASAAHEPGRTTPLAVTALPLSGHHKPLWGLWWR